MFRQVARGQGGWELLEMRGVRIRTRTFNFYILSYIFIQQIHQVCLLLLPACCSHSCSVSLQPRKAEQPWPCSRVGRLAVFPDLAPREPCWSFNVVADSELSTSGDDPPREWADESQERGSEARSQKTKLIHVTLLEPSGLGKRNLWGETRSGNEGTDSVSHWSFPWCLVFSGTTSMGLGESWKWLERNESNQVQKIVDL